MQTISHVALVSGRRPARQWRGGLDPADHAYGATIVVLAAYGCLHGVIATLMLAFVRFRIFTGHISPTRRLEPKVARHWLRYGCAVIAITAVVIAIPGGATWRW